MCVCAFVRACVRASVCVCVCVCDSVRKHDVTKGIPKSSYNDIPIV